MRDFIVWYSGWTEHIQAESPKHIRKAMSTKLGIRFKTAYTWREFNNSKNSCFGRVWKVKSL